MELTNIQFLKIKDKLCHAVPYCNKCPIMKFGKEKGEVAKIVDIIGKLNNPTEKSRNWLFFL